MIGSIYPDVIKETIAEAPFLWYGHPAREGSATWPDGRATIFQRAAKGRQDP